MESSEVVAVQWGHQREWPWGGVISGSGCRVASSEGVAVGWVH